MQPANLPSLEVALCDCKASDDVSSHPISIGAASSSVGLMVTRAITITARSAPASDGEALHMNAYHTSNLIHVLRLSLDPAKGSRTASCRTRCCSYAIARIFLQHVLQRMPTAAGQVRAPSELMHLKGGIADAACWRLLHSCGCCHE